ncbi:hypothetical protein SSABA_v1c05830 [Spiroplasma sabaudiense Ar-1343]|uniref:Lipoprotein n=1 Tax=Spiroplasma sabaudiense Ar-1343 TaxID=1276257 RepID=W6AA97_9MOLU|nr:lipoprotein [Spiroplasma sabaudiense]AHI53987.1 hypothetical protein SSABA_v1c05830 [Spiroplasma sabaudiense Ar-1343]
MKKLLAVLAASSLVAASSSAVVACTNELSNYNTFKDWIQRRETFILYVGAEDCPVCQSFVKATTGKVDGDIETFSNNVNNGNNQDFNDLTNNYNNSLKEGDEDIYENGFGTKVNQVKFHHFVEEKKDKINSKKWWIKIKEWILEQYKIQYKIHNIPEGDPNFITKDWTIDTLKITSIPVFIVIRDGKFVNLVQGFDDTTGGVGEATALQNLMLKFDEILRDQSSFYQPVGGGDEGTEGETGDGGIDQSGENQQIDYNSRKFNYNFNK